MTGAWRSSTRVVVVLGFGILLLSPSCAKQNAWERAYAEASKVIATREKWPASPEAVCEAFWEARRAKDYKELEVLWPGSASWNWAEICKDDSDVRYVFGQANDTASEVPYAAEEYFKENGSYNLAMKIGSLQTPGGTRYFIVSAN